jgi:outer membrane protein assembly factor BamB
VALEDQVYLADRAKVLCLDPASGKTLRSMALPAESATGEFIADIRCVGSRLLAITPRVVLAWNRQDGALLWRQPADVNVLNRVGWNSGLQRTGLFAAGNDKVFVVTGMSAGVSPKELRYIGRTAVEVPAAGTPQAILALDATNGKTLWSKPFEKGFLSLQYSESQDVLIQTPGNWGSHNRDVDKTSEKVVAYRGSDGKELWTQKPEVGPYLLHGERLFTQGESNGQQARAYDMRTGSRQGPLAFRRGTCCHMLGSRNLLVFSNIPAACAGYFDLLANREGSFYSFRPGCRNALTAGDGVLVAPMFANGCTCSYPIWTSLALIPMPYPSRIPERE